MSGKIFRVGGEYQLLVLRLKSNLIFDRANEFGRNGDKLDAYPHALEAITDLASSLDYDAGSREPEAQFQDRALGILGACVDEHAVRAQVRGPNINVFFESFVNHGEFAQLRMAYIPPELSTRFVVCSIHDEWTSSSGLPLKSSLAAVAGWMGIWLCSASRTRGKN